jgi:hypothetical protein
MPLWPRHATQAARSHDRKDLFVGLLGWLMSQCFGSNAFQAGITQGSDRKLLVQGKEELHVTVIASVLCNSCLRAGSGSAALAVSPTSTPFLRISGKTD